MLASLACASRRLACRYWRVASPSEKTARPHAVSRVRDEVKRALRCARRAPRSPWVPRRTARSWRGIVPLTRLAREGRMTVTIGRRELLAALRGGCVAVQGSRATAGDAGGRISQKHPSYRLRVYCRCFAAGPE